MLSAELLFYQLDGGEDVAVVFLGVGELSLSVVSGKFQGTVFYGRNIVHVYGYAPAYHRQHVVELVGKVFE